MAATHAKAETVEVETLEVETLEVETLRGRAGRWLLKQFDGDHPPVVLLSRF